MKLPEPFKDLSVLKDPFTWGFAVAIGLFLVNPVLGTIVLAAMVLGVFLTT